MVNSPTILAPASVQAENAHHAEAEPLNGNGFYRFKIGDFQATVISDGYGPIPAPIFAANASDSRYESEVNSSPMPDPFKEGTIGAARENLPPIADRSRFVKQGGEITSGVHYIAAPGHSPSHAAILFASGNEQLMHMGDIAHHPVTSLQHPDWTPVFDYEPAQAITSRKAILDRVATDRVMVLGYHFPFPALGHVVRRDTAYHWEAAQWAW
jgi:glyoxylase-like metal-dependent hydrolase (beta-lactamase superfamily II)